MIQDPAFWLILFVSVAAYWMLPKLLRDWFLATVSFAYVAFLDPMTASVLVVWVLLFFYLAPRTVAAAKYKSWILPSLILAILAYLAYYKYLPQIAAFASAQAATGSLVVPLGISYFTFKLIHYAVEVVRGNIRDHSLGRFFCYIFLFPIFTAGPIERFDHFLANREKTWKLQSTVEGVTRIVHGLIKIFVVANLLRLPELNSGIIGTGDLISRLSGLDTYQVWIFVALAYLYAYVDFSAYSDIAIGASRLFGFRIMENFRFPIIAMNISDFWRRWHMTLAAWCQAYVYVPTIGLTRKPYVAIFCTFIVMGLWHGGSWNWLGWGLYHAAGVSIFTAWGRVKRKRGWTAMNDSALRYAGIPVTFAFVSGSYAFSSTAGHGAWPAIQILAKLFGINLAVLASYTG
jgi:alginate O-acetyltransferase complex protein AlgI